MLLVRRDVSLSPGILWYPKCRQGDGGWGEHEGVFEVDSCHCSFVTWVRFFAESENAWSNLGLQ